MFEELSSKLNATLQKLTGRGVLTEEAVKEGLREIRRVLLEADVSFDLTREFLERVQQKAVGVTSRKDVRPGHQLVKIVYDELVALLGERQAPLAYATVPPTVILLVGLQGSGKTTTAGKLARRLKLEQKAPLLVADGMTGQDAVRIAQGFHDALGITGVILTKMDGDARGGAALSIYGVTKKPIKYIGVGEKSDALEDFYPERMAGRILQQGDIVTLVEKAQSTFDEAEAKRLEKKVRKEGMDLSDFLTAMRQIEKLGPLEGILGMLPGVNAKVLKQAKSVDPRRMKHVEAIVLSMTPGERKNPGIINGSRRARIAKGSGRPVNEVNRLLEQFREMRKMMKKFGGMAAGGGKIRPGMFGMR